MCIKHDGRYFEKEKNMGDEYIFSSTFELFFVQKSRRVPSKWIHQSGSYKHNIEGSGLIFEKISLKNSNQHFL